MRLSEKCFSLPVPELLQDQDLQVHSVLQVQAMAG